MKKNYATSLILGGILSTSLSAQVVFSENFNSSLGNTTAQNSSNGAWIWTNSCARSAMPGHSASGSAFFQGNGNTCVFADANFNAVSGDLTTPSIAIGSLGAILTFNYSLQNECGTWGSSCFYDNLTVKVSTNGGASWTDILSSDYNAGGLYNGTGWVGVSYTLSAANYANQNVLIRFTFNSIDGIGNNFDGVYVDDIEVLNFQNCSSAPPSNTTVATSTLICPFYGTAGLSFQNNTAALLGLTYQWYESSTSNVGPFTPISGANSPTMITPTLNATAWYQAVIQCGFTSQSTTVSAITISVEPVVVSNVPYFEGFEGIAMDDQLPNCSWFASDNPGGNTQTYTAPNSANRLPRTGNKFASFFGYFVNGTEEFWTNGIYMQPGITYSASMWYTTEAFGYTNWTDLTILLNNVQDSTNATVLASTVGPVLSPIYKSLSNTFQVSSPGIYYVGIQATSNGNCCGEYLSWDDLLIEIPCSLNTPTVNLSTSATSVCAGDQVNLTANGATSYSWSTGASGATIVENPLYDVTYNVIGLDTLTGCSSSMSQFVTVFPKPNLTTFATPPVICSGAQSYISASGALTYSWSNAQSGQVITVNPASTASYTVVGYNQYNCASTAVQQVMVNQLPNVVANADRTDLCSGEQVTLTGTGATTYQWMSQSSFVQGQQVMVTPNVNTSYTLNGTDANGCSKSTTILLNVSECVGINEAVSTLSGVRVYPNPTEGALTVEVSGDNNKSVEVLDLTGRVVMSNTLKGHVMNVNISHLANGIYYVKIQSDNASDVIKIVKQ